MDQDSAKRERGYNFWLAIGRIPQSYNTSESAAATNVILVKIYFVVQVFSEMDFLGWYSTGEAPTEDDIHVHKQVSYF